MKRVISSLLALTLLVGLTISVAPAASAHPAQRSQAPTCLSDVPLSTPAVKARLIQTLGAKGEDLVAHMKQRFIPANQCGVVDPGSSLAGQAAPGALTNTTTTTSAHTSQSGTCCQLTNAAWGGYYVDETNSGTNTNGVESDFNAEFVSCSVCTFYSWVGIGGVNGNQDLDQVGINMRSDKHFAWWCAWDHPYNKCQETGTVSPTQLFSVSQGQNIYGSVTRYSPGVWEFYIEDTSNGSWFETTYAWSPNATTADWITELSASQNGTIPQFSDITYGNDYWYDSNGNPYGASHNINDNKTIIGIECFPENGQWAEPGSVYDYGTAFTYYWGA